ncbi:hypothetical protein IWW38_006163 [Coemansia aciculifera]|uniref:Uncharacterized protein n=1 Tax=Coemansia aciculifera TaxID=417176 RepID=A0ACC1LTL9_9FUNG|nr:hypothetical protein IWW38_006163 [Coemansia aciculifera]
MSATIAAAEASRSTIIKSLLTREGPKTINQLYMALHTSYPDNFKGMSRHKFKRVYLKNLKEFKHIKVKVCRDPDVLEKLRNDPESRVSTTAKEAWMIEVEDSLARKYLSGDVDLGVNHKQILDKINSERTKSKDFWEGKTNVPHDWRAVLNAAGEKTSL